MEKEYEEAGKNIDEVSKEESFYKKEESFIRGVLKAAKRVKVETGKRIVEGLMRELGNKCLDLLCDFDVNFNVDFENKRELLQDEKSVRLSQQLRDVLGPLTEVKIVGIKVFKFLIEQIERGEEKKTGGDSTNIKLYFESRKESDDNGNNGNEVEEGLVEIDWEGMYRSMRTEIVRLLLEESKYEDMMEETKKFRDIPLEERVKIIRKKYERIKRIKALTDEEAVKKYVKDERDQEKCLKILKDIREGEIGIGDRKRYSAKEDPLLKAVKQVIEANDLPSLITLSKGCYLPSDISIYLGKRLYSLFEYSCMAYSDECALYLLEEGGGVHQKFDEGDRPLHQALSVGNEAIGMFLIERGANCKVVGREKDTPLHYAAKRNYIEIAKLLIEKGADIEAKDEVGRTPLHYATMGNGFEVAKLLIERGADIEAKDDKWDQSTPLHVAALLNSFEVAQLLIEKGADIEAKDVVGRTPLHEAAHSNSYEVAKLLIERGADIEAKDKNGETPLHWAACCCYYEVAKLLIESGADIEAKDKAIFGRTPLMMAKDQRKYCEKYGCQTYDSLKMIALLKEAKQR